MNEFDFITQIRALARRDVRVPVGIGDDAAVLRFSKDRELLFTTDMLIEGRHFKLKEASAFEIGRKAMAVNLSDIAAMGGVPTLAVVAVGLPKKCMGRFAKELYRGLRSLEKKFHVAVVGGDTNASEKVIVSVALLGQVEKGRALLRSGARVGDALCVSGTLGGSYVSKKHLNFTPRVKEARYLAKNFKVHALMDISDGLASDARRICEQSGVGALLDERSIPVARAAKNVAQALNDGEDFELLFTLSQKEASRLPRFYRVLGRVMPKKHGLKLLKKNGVVVSLRGGFDHFK